MEQAPSMDEVDDALDAWHESNTSMTIYEWLGWTHDEYRAWVERCVIPARPLPTHKSPPSTE